jgi:hypothetical protein
MKIRAGPRKKRIPQNEGNHNPERARPISRFSGSHDTARRVYDDGITQDPVAPPTSYCV